MIADLNQEGSTQPERVLEGSQLTLDTPRGGSEWQPKSGPGPRAKADARKAAANRANAGVRKTGQTASSGSSIFVEGYIPHNIYCNHYHKDGNMPSCRQAHKNICPPDDQGKYLKLDQDGYCVNERGKKFVRVEHEQAKFETPENKNDPVQEASEVTGTETTTLTTDIRKLMPNQSIKIFLKILTGRRLTHILNLQTLKLGF